MSFVDDDVRWAQALEQIECVCKDNARAARKDLALEFIIQAANAALKIPTLAKTLGDLERAEQS